jgi:hypothetical protein
MPVGLGDGGGEVPKISTKQILEPEYFGFTPVHLIYTKLWLPWTVVDFGGKER